MFSNLKHNQFRKLCILVLMLVLYGLYSIGNDTMAPNILRDFSDSRQQWIAQNARRSSDLHFTSTEHPMIRHPVPIVPNIVHFIKFRMTEISFNELVSIRAAHVNQRPDAIYFHCNLCVNGTTMGGLYWDMLMQYNPPIQVRYLPEPVEIFGQKFTSRYHASDVGRMLVLMEHGGIYLDNDVYLINPLDEFFHYELSLGWDVGTYMGTQILVAHRNARFLRLWYDSYRHYDGTQWYYNAGQLPTTSILMPKPYLVNRVHMLFGVQFSTTPANLLYKTVWDGWRSYYTIHYMIRHRHYLDSGSPIVNFDHVNIRTYDRTFGQMARLVLYNTTDIMPEIA